MIHLVIGDDTYRRRQIVHDIIARATVEPETFDGTSLGESQLADCIAGATLFSSERLIIMSDLSQNKPLWDKLADWLGRVSSDTTLVLLEYAVDKRTKTYKTIAKSATLHAADSWTDRHTGEAVRWVASRAKALHVPLSMDQAAAMVSRATGPGTRPGAYTIDQQQLETALQSLSVLDNITGDSIAAVLPESSADNVFELMEVALSGNKKRTSELLSHLHATADPYLTLGFVTSQWTQLAALTLSGESPDTLAPLIGAHPFVLKKLQRHVPALSHARLKELTDLLASLDIKTKTTGIDPWVAVDRFIGEVVAAKSV